MKISEMSFFSTILAILRGQPQNGLVVLSEAWWRGQTRENVSAWTKNRRKTEVGEKWFGRILTETDYRERYMVRRAPTKQDPASIQVLPSRLWSCEDRICCFVPTKTFQQDKMLP